MIMDEYLVKLGAAVDQSGMARFHTALREASMASNVSATSIAGSFFKAQTEIIGGFAAIGGAALGLVDKVAMADQSYRLFALHMYMGKENARGLKVAMDALGASLEDMTWDKELRDRTHQLLIDQQAMSPNGDFDAQMKKVRDIRFEFTRMEVEGQYLAMHVVQDFLKALGFGPDELLNKLKGFNDWVTHNMPEISQKIVTIFLPVWHDVKDVFTAVGAAAMATGTAFTNLVGLFTGDDSIMGKTFDLEKFAKALGHITHGFAVFAEAITNVEELLAHLVSALTLVAAGKFTEAGAELKAAAHDVSAKTYGLVTGGLAGGVIGGGTGSVAGGLIGGAIGSLIGPEGTVAGAAAGSALFGSIGAGGGSLAGGFIGANSVKDGTTHLGSGAVDVHDLIDRYAASMGLDPAIAHAVAMHESGEHQYDKHGALLKNPGSSATGAFQLLNGTAKFLGVDSSNTEGNVKGGVSLLSQMLQRYQGNVPKALGGYAVGGGEMDQIIAGKMTPHRGEALASIASELRMMGKHGDVQIGSITVHIDKKNATNEDVGNVIAAKIRSSQDKKVQRNLAEFQDLSWST